MQVIIVIIKRGFQKASIIRLTGQLTHEGQAQCNSPSSQGWNSVLE